jgi:hypothetical protein
MLLVSYFFSADQGRHEGYSCWTFGTGFDRDFLLIDWEVFGFCYGDCVRLVDFRLFCYGLVSL